MWTSRLRFFPLGTWIAAMTFVYYLYSALVIRSFTDQIEKKIDSLDQLVARTDLNLTAPAHLVDLQKQVYVNHHKPCHLDQTCSSTKFWSLI